MSVLSLSYYKKVMSE